MLSMERAHRAVPMTGALGLAVACRIEGSIPHALATRGPRPEEIRVGHPSGIVAVGAEVRQAAVLGGAEDDDLHLGAPGRRSRCFIIHPRPDGS
jgi:2-methylaconitate cis-trans-isomerase PrpF